MAPSTRSTRAAALPRTPIAPTATAPAKSTRSRKGQAQSQSQAQQQPAAAPNNKKRRLRSAKPENASPLQLGVPTTTRKKATLKSKASKATKPTAEHDDAESVASAGTGDGDADSDADPGASIFFSEEPFSLSTPEHRKLLSPTSDDGEEQKDHFDVLNPSPTSTIFFTPQTINAELEAQLLAANKRNRKTRYQANSLEEQNRKLQTDLLEKRRPEVQYLVREYRPDGIIQGSERAIQLLHDVENRARKQIASNAQPVSSEPNKGKEAAVQADEPAQLSAPIPPAATPQSQGFFGRVKNFLKSPFRSSPFPQSSQSPQASSLTETLTPSPTPVGESHSRHRKPKKSSNRSRIIQKVVDSVPDSEKVKAKQWAESVLQNVTEDGSLKRKRQEIELGVTIGNLEHLQGTKPWNKGTFGLDDDIADLEDDDHAPAWAVLHNQMQLDQDAQQPPTKKRKAIHDASHKHDFTPLGSSVSDGLSPLPHVIGHYPSSSSSGSPLFNSGGKTASRHDVQPRRAIEPSPMFDADTNHRNGTNVFNELQGSSSSPQTSTQKRAAVQEASPREDSVKEADFSNGFCVPEGSSDEEDGDDDYDTHNTPPKPVTSTLWTQEPPPAPVPSHASLPTPLGDAPATPAPAAAATAASEVDPVEHQRAKAMKHTPGKPSRLREVSVPSPSVKSDAGSPAPVSLAVPTQLNGFNWDMSKEATLEFPSDVEMTTSEILQSDRNDTGPGSSWDDPDISYDEDAMSF